MQSVKSSYEEHRGLNWRYAANGFWHWLDKKDENSLKTLTNIRRSRFGNGNGMAYLKELMESYQGVILFGITITWKPWYLTRDSPKIDIKKTPQRLGIWQTNFSINSFGACISNLTSIRGLSFNIVGFRGALVDERLQEIHRLRENCAFHVHTD